MTQPNSGFQMESQHHPRRTNGLAIASLVLGIVGVSLLAVIFGHVARNQIKRTPNMEGKGMAMTGLVLGYIGVGLYLLLIITGVFMAEATMYEYQQYDQYVPPTYEMPSMPEMPTEFCVDGICETIPT